MSLLLDLGAGLENRKGRQWWGGGGGTEGEESLDLSSNPVCHLLAGDSVSQSIKWGDNSSLVYFTQF